MSFAAGQLLQSASDMCTTNSVLAGMVPVFMVILVVASASLLRFDNSVEQEQDPKPVDQAVVEEGRLYNRADLDPLPVTMTGGPIQCTEENPPIDQIR